MFDREIMELNCLAFAEAGESPCQMQPDEKARVCPASHLSIPRMDVRRKREGGKRRVIVRRGGKEEAEKESKEENKAERPSRRREMEEVGGGGGGGKRGDISRTMSPSVSRAFKECPLCAVT